MAETSTQRPSPTQLRPRRARDGRRLLAFATAALVALAIALALSGRRDIPREAMLAKYASAASRFADIEGMQVHYRDEGAGPAVVLLHGTASSLHTWEPWTASLATHRRVVRLDLAGFGLTGPAPDRDYTAKRQARVVAALLDRLGIARADFVGNSLGGRVAITLALDAPSRVRRLVLVDAAGLSGQLPPRVFRLARTPGLREILTVVTPRALVRKNVEEVYGDPSRITEELVDRYVDVLLREGNRRAFVDRVNGPRDPDLDARLGELAMPVLLLWGERDRWIPRAFADRFAAGIRGAKLVTYPDAGHTPMEELPAETLRDTRRFFDDSVAAL